jgi:predicted transcriptional regulator
MSTIEFNSILAFFKALSDESRLKIVGILANKERSVEELASLLELRAPTVSHHLARLKEVGLVTMRSEGTTHIYRLNMKELRSLSKQMFAMDTIVTMADSMPTDTWECKIITDFFDGSRLKEIPASRKKREVVLKWLCERFKHGIRYKEKEVNEIISCHHPDFATLRRELIGAGLLKRENSIYWRPAEENLVID